MRDSEIVDTVKELHVGDRVEVIREIGGDWERIVGTYDSRVVVLGRVVAVGIRRDDGTPTVIGIGDIVEVRRV